MTSRSTQGHALHLLFLRRKLCCYYSNTVDLMVHLPKLFLANVSSENMFTSPNTTQHCKQNDAKKLRLTLQIQQIERGDEVEVEVPECQQRGFSKLLPTKPPSVKEPVSS